MREKSLLEEIQEAELKGADAEAQFAAKLGRLSDAEFMKVSAYLCRRGDEAKGNAKPEPRQVSQEEKCLDALNARDYNDYLRSIGINAGFLEEPLGQPRELPK